MKQKQIDNEQLKLALSDSKNVISAINEANDYDDEQLLKLQKFNDLTQFEKDLLYLCSTMPSIIEVSKLYSCSRQYIYKLLHKIQQKLI